ncbi:MAG: PH domain-containing protein [Bacteroidetes bacterium]|nr:MAG: PH domain-containing protein [Bacteroidota bacterium]
MNTSDTAVYRSGVSAGLAAFLIAVLGGVWLLFAWNGMFGALALQSAVSLFVAHILLSTKYTLDGGTLTVVSGFLFHRDIAVERITAVTPTRSPLSAPAASFDRLEIRVAGEEPVVISPKEKEAFIARLTALNPSIAVTR